MLKEILLAILSLMGVIALIFLTFYASRALHKRMYSFSGKHIKIVEREMLSQDKSLIVIKIGEKYMLLGVTPQHIDKLYEFSDGEFSEETELPQNENGTFLDNLKKATAEHPYIKPLIKKKERSEQDENE